MHARPLLAAGYILVADDAGMVRALRPDNGSIRWITALGAPVYSGMATHAGRLYVPTTRGKLFTLEAASGKVLWTYVHADTTVRIATAAADSTMVVFGASDGTVTALEATSGAARWQWQGSDAIAAAPYVNAHAAYVGTMGQRIYALDRNSGAVRWQEGLRGRVKSAIVGCDDFLLVPVRASPCPSFTERCTGSLRIGMGLLLAPWALAQERAALAVETNFGDAIVYNRFGSDGTGVLAHFCHDPRGP